MPEDADYVPDYGMAGKGEWIAIIGTPDGDEHVGLFGTDEEAIRFAQEHSSDCGWSVRIMTRPEDYPKKKD